MPANNLPLQPTPFVGREKELAEIAALLADPACRLLTLVGPGGIGKTRLALQAAVSQQPHFIDGVSFVSLAPVGSPDLIPSAIAGALEITFYGSEEPRIQLAHYLREKHMLLVVDNVEHLLEGMGLLTELLQAAPGLKIFATSRERLNLQEEWAFALDGLSYPPETDVDSLENYSAVQLFLQRARQVNTHFSLDENKQAVLSICRKVEGMPLGLELAVSWLRVMSCQQIVAQMMSSLDFLTTSLRNIPERHRSLRMVFDQSWRFLSSEEQAVLMKLSVFRGSFDLEAAEQVAGASLPVLAGLADKSLIRLNATGRYDLHELLRQYAADQLVEAGLAITTIQRHIDYFLNLAEQAEAHLFGREQIVWFDRLEVEFDNLRAALAGSAETEVGLRLAAALGWFFSERSYWNEGLTWLEQTLAANPSGPSSLRGKALNRAGAYAGHLGDNLRLQAYCGEAIAVARSTNDYRTIAWSLSHLGVYNNTLPELNGAAAQLEESVALFRQLEDPMGLAHNLVRLSWNAIDRNDFPYARILLDEAAALTNVAGDAIMSGWIAMTLGDIALLTHDYKQARIEYEASFLYFQQGRFPDGVYASLTNLARAELAIGNLELSQNHLKKALILNRGRLHHDGRTSDVLLGLASVAQGRRHFERAAQLLAAAYNEGLVYWSQELPERYPYLSDIAAVREQMGDDSFNEAWAAGKAMTRQQAIAYALEDSTSPTEIPLTIPASDQPLTERELDILRLMTDGLNSREIAERLVLSVGTVRWYLKQIYSKLHVHGRSEAIARAKELKLLV